MRKPSGRAITLVSLINANKWTRGAELGVYDGATAGHLLGCCPALHLIGVDNWAGNDAAVKSKDTGEAPYSEKMMAEARTDAFCVYLTFPARFHVYNMSTLDAAAKVDDGSLDFIFIDADHRTDAVVKDISAWRPKVRKGGMMLGHDADWPSVIRALEISTIHPPLHFPGNVWGKQC